MRNLMAGIFLIRELSMVPRACPWGYTGLYMGFFFLDPTLPYSYNQLTQKGVLISYRFVVESEKPDLFNMVVIKQTNKLYKAEHEEREALRR